MDRVHVTVTFVSDHNFARTTNIANRVAENRQTVANTMFNKHEHLSLFFPEPMSTRDWSNLTASGVRRVQLFMNNCTSQTLNRMRDLGVSVIVRVEEVDAATMPAALLRYRLSTIASHPAVIAAIIGNEPEHEYDLSWDSENWGNKPDEKYTVAKMWKHQSHMDVLRQVLSDLGILLITPGWKMRSISEDEPAQPGRVAWSDACRIVYNHYDGNGVHIYGYGWESAVDEWRVKKALQEAQSLFHRNLWINEFNVNSGAPLKRMQSWIDFNRILSDPELPFGKRVDNSSLFVSNGNGNGWDINYRINQSEAYDLLRAYIDER